MLDLTRAYPADQVIEVMSCTDAARVIAVAANCAGLRAIDQEQHAHSIRQAGQDYPTTPLLVRPADAVIGADQAKMLTDLTARFIASLRPKSPASEVLGYASLLSLARWPRAGAFIVGHKIALWPAEVTFSASVPCRAVEDCDVRVIGMMLCESAALAMDRAFFSSIGNMAGRPPGGILHKVLTIPASGVSTAMHRDLDRLTAAVATSRAPRFLIGGPKQAEAIRRGSLTNGFMVRESSALAGSVVAVTPEKVLAGFGPCRMQAKVLPSRQAVELQVGAILAWKTFAPDAVAYVKDVENW
jgi:hypothetical protein